jgi:uncharacterized protein YcfL
LCGVLALLVVGCTAHPKQVDEEGRVWIEDTNLKLMVKVVRQESDRVEGGLLRVRTDIQNKQKENLWVDIQVVWKDAKGFKVYETNWAPLMLPARFTTTHEIVSMKGDVADYEYRIRGGSKSVKLK